MKKSAFLLAFGVVAASSQAQMVDNFSVPFAFSMAAATSWVGVSTPPPGVVLTGERDIEMAITANPNVQFLDLTINAGLSITSSGFGTDSRVKLQYDGVGDEAGNTGFGKTLTNSSSSAGFLGAGNDRVRLNWLGNDLDVTATVELRAGGSLIASSSLLRAGGSGAGAQDHFFTVANIAAADSLTVVLDGVPSADFALRSIETVPEPATLAALGVGAAALMRRRKKA